MNLRKIPASSQFFSGLYPQKNNYYFLLARLLSPWKTEHDLATIRKLIEDNPATLDWLLILANQHLCSPQFFLELKNQDLRALMPHEMSEYLDAIIHLNRERNETLQGELELILKNFQQQGIEIIIMKGGACFVDQLYADVGARIMQDLDLLVKPTQLEQARQVMLGLGYEEAYKPGMAKEGLPIDARHCHLPPFYKSEKQSVVELHFDVGYGQIGRLFDLNVVWDKRVKSTFRGQPISTFNPTYRVLHNAAHALIPEREFIRGKISIRQLLELVMLVKRYGDEIDWNVCFHLFTQEGLKTELLTYLRMADIACAMRMPSDENITLRAQIHANRLIVAGSGLSVPSTVPLPRQGTKRQIITKTLCWIYYWANIPHWLWTNVCYVEGGGHVFLRIRQLLKKIKSTESRARIKF